MRNLRNRSGIIPRCAKGFNVLLVDCDIVSLHVLSDMLREYKFKVSTAALGMDAVALVRKPKNPIQFILANIDFADITFGYFLFLLKDDSVPIILMSTGDARMISAREVGALMVVEKPFCKEDMRDILQRVEWRTIIANKRIAEKKRREQMRTVRLVGIAIREPRNNNNNPARIMANGVSNGRVVVTHPNRVERMMKGKSIIIIDDGDDDNYKGGDRSQLKGEGLLVEKEQEKWTKALINQQAHFNFGDHQNGNYKATSIQEAMMNDLVITKSGLKQQDISQDLINNKTIAMRDYVPAIAKQSWLIPDQHSQGNLNLFVGAAFSHSTSQQSPPLPPNFFDYSQSTTTVPPEFNPGPTGSIQNPNPSEQNTSVIGNQGLGFDGSGSSNHNAVPFGADIGALHGFDPAIGNTNGIGANGTSQVLVGFGATATEGPGNIRLPNMSFPGEIGPHENLDSYPFGNPNNGALQFQTPAVLHQLPLSNYGAMSAMAFPSGSADSSPYLSQSLDGVAQFQTTPAALQQVGSYGAVHASANGNNDNEMTSLEESNIQVPGAMNFIPSAAANYPSSYAPQNPNNSIGFQTPAPLYGSMNAGSGGNNMAIGLEGNSTIQVPQVMSFPSFAANSSPYLSQNPSGGVEFQSPSVPPQVISGYGAVNEFMDNGNNMMMRSLEGNNNYTQVPGITNFPSGLALPQNPNAADSWNSYLPQNPSYYYAYFEAYDQPVIRNPSRGLVLQNGRDEAGFLGFWEGTGFGVPVPASLEAPRNRLNETEFYNYSSYLLQNSNSNNNSNSNSYNALFENCRAVPQVPNQTRPELGVVSPTDHLGRTSEFVTHVLDFGDEAVESNYFAFNRTFEDVDKYCEWIKKNPNGKSISVDDTTPDRTR